MNPILKYPGANKRIARVFPRRTSMTPDDPLAFALDRDKNGNPKWEKAIPPRVGLPEIDEVHISVAFSWDMEIAEYLAKQWEVVGVPVYMGGPAFNQPGGDFTPGLYTKRGVVATSRGCPNGCWFCAVPEREKGLRELPITDGWNVIDDNLLACGDEHIKAVFAMLKRQPHPAIFTGGLEARILQPWHAEALKALHPERMYFAYDTPDDYEPLVQAGKVLREAGHTVASHAMRCYVLIGYRGDTFERAEKRLMDTIRAGFFPYAMLFRDEVGIVDRGLHLDPMDNKNKTWKAFQREWLRPKIVGTKMREAWKEAL